RGGDGAVRIGHNARRCITQRRGELALLLDFVFSLLHLFGFDLEDFSHDDHLSSLCALPRGACCSGLLVPGSGSRIIAEARIWNRTAAEPISSASPNGYLDVLYCGARRLNLPISICSFE